MADHGGRILVVDDNKINRMVLVRGLTAQGHTVATAENGRQALDLLRGQPFDVVLLDILMPELDGYETLALIKDDESLRHVPVIMISAVDEMESVIRCIGMGAADYLPKPFNAALLEARINSSLATKRLRDLELEYIEQAGQVATAATAVEQGMFESQSLVGVAGRDDALGRLARVFLRMAEEVHLREQRLRRQLERLHMDMAEMRQADAETLGVYLPMDRRQALVHGKDLPDRTDGTALFADLSGSTQLTEALARELGLQRGAEEISRQLNRVFGALVGEVGRYGGSVISFAGDAIACWFDGDDGLRAVASALAMQDAMAQFAAVATPTGTVVSLGIKVAVVAGPVRRFLVGDPTIHQIEVLAGGTLDELAAAEHLAARGDVIVGATIVDTAAQSLALREWRDDPGSGHRFGVVAGLAEPVPPSPWPDLPADALPESRCRPWVIPAVYERVRGGRRSFLSELRPVVSLRLQFAGIDYDNDAGAAAKLDGFVRWVQAVVARHDGCLLRVSTGDKGSAMHIAFGTPVAHEDDAQRAVSAALELHRLPSRLPFVAGVQIGIAQGLTWTGAYGSPGRRTYGVQGNEVILASRLMQAADGTILCDEAVHRAAQPQYAFETLPAIAVKGRDERVPVYRPVEPRGQPPAEITVAGREVERAILREALEAVRHGKRRTIIIEGEAAMGKSWLLDDLRRQAQAANAKILSGAGSAGREVASFDAWRGVYGHLLGVSSQTSPVACRQTIAEHLQDRPELLAWAPLLSPVLPCALVDEPGAVQLVGEPRTEMRRRVLIALLQWAVRDVPAMIILDDAHLMDAASWQLALDVSQQVCPCLLVIATYPIVGPAPPAAVSLMQSPDVCHIQLSPLSPAEVQDVVCEFLGVSSVPKPVAEVILEGAEGHPLLCVELARALRDDGYIVVEQDGCTVAPGRNLRQAAFPSTVHGIINSRLDRLSPSERLVLKVASVVGRTFDVRIVRDIYAVDVDTDELQDVLDALEVRGLVERDATRQQVTYRFRSVATWEAVYATLLFAQRRQLHRAVAEWHERACDGDIPAEYSTLAHHWRRADNPAKAIEYLEKAGQQAAREGSFEQAEGFLQESLELNAEAAVLSADYYSETSTTNANSAPRL